MPKHDSLTDRIWEYKIMFAALYGDLHRARVLAQLARIRRWYHL